MKIIALLAGLGFLVGSSGSPGVVSSAPGPDDGRSPAWSWPLAMVDGKSPEIVRPFRPPARRWLPGHRGVDLAAPPGAAVMAAGAGTVSFAGTLFGEDIVVVSHGGVRTSYEPVAAQVHVGQRVVRGDVLGTLTTDEQSGEPGATTGPPTTQPGTVLHWGLLAGHGHGVRYYDPLLLLGFGHLRLEPAFDPAGPPSP